MKGFLTPWIARAISSRALLNFKRFGQEVKRICLRRPHVLSVFLRVDDPYSYLLLQVIPELKQRYAAEVACYVVSELPENMYPEPQLWHANAHKDAAYLAKLYQLSSPKTFSHQPKAATEALTAVLVSKESQPDFIGKALTLLAQYWNGEHDYEQAVDRNARLKQNDQLLASKGHYLSGTIHYAKEWYWGLDRLDHLERRLNDLGVSCEEAVVKYAETSRYFCQRIGDLSQYQARPSGTLTIYFSARSPYSYLGLERGIALAEHYGINYQIKPVLPMMMRGMNVPPMKKWYIFSDTKREADKFGINYGFVADPLGVGVERCYALFDYANSEGKGAIFLSTFARAVNAQGIRSETDSGLKRIVEDSGLDWATAQPLLGNQQWRSWADANYQDMHALNLWGVPCFEYNNITAWGQDRLDLIEHAIYASVREVNTD